MQLVVVPGLEIHAGAHLRRAHRHSPSSSSAQQPWAPEELAKAVRKAEYQADKQMKRMEILREECRKAEKQQGESSACVAEKTAAAKLKRLETKVEQLRTVDEKAEQVNNVRKMFLEKVSKLEAKERELRASRKLLVMAKKDADGRQRAQQTLARQFRKKQKQDKERLGELEGELAAARDKAKASEDRAINVAADAESVAKSLTNVTADSWSEARLVEAGKREERARRLLSRAKEIAKKTGKVLGRDEEAGQQQDAEEAEEDDGLLEDLTESEQAAASAKKTSDSDTSEDDDGEEEKEDDEGGVSSTDDEEQSDGQEEDDDDSPDDA